MSRLLSVSLPDDLMDAVERQAEQHGVTRSEMVRDALRREIERDRWDGLFRYGEGLAERRGLGPEDVESLVDEVRGDLQAERAGA